MGARIDILNLYELTGGTQRYLLVEAVRERYHNASQTAEDEAYDHADQRFEQVIGEQRDQLGFTDAKLIGVWEDHRFYGDGGSAAPARATDLDIWFTIETRLNRYMLIGLHSTEDEFWKFVQEMDDDDDLVGYEGLIRPAKRMRVLFLPG